MKKKLLIPAALILFGISAASANALDMNTGDMLYFDFGNEVYESPWITVDNTTYYSTDKGYGFSDLECLENQSSSYGTLADAVAAKSGMEDAYDFKIDVPDGLYEITVYAGNIVYMNVKLEGAPAMLNVMYSGAESTVEIPITDGQLNVGVAKSVEGDNLAITALTVKRTGDSADRRRRLFVCGDSTASTYYPESINHPFNEGDRGGWGQMMQTYLPDVYVHNYATQGQTPKTFVERGFLDGIQTFLQADDYVLVAYGINDYLYGSREEYIEYMGTIIEQLKSTGAHVVVASETPQLDDLSPDGGYEYHDRCFAAEAQWLAAEHEVDFIDLNAKFSRFINSIGYNNAYNYYWLNWSGKKDPIHLNRNGAGEAARILSDGLAELHPDVFPGSIRRDTGGDPRVYSYTDGDTVRLENLTLSPMSTACLLTLIYHDGALVETRTQRLELNAYDPAAPNRPQEFTVPQNTGERHSYLVGNFLTIKID